MYQYPYGNAQQLNLDWLMEQWQEVKQSIDGSLQGEIDRVEAAITDLLNARDAAVAAATAAGTSATAAAQSAQAAAGDAATATAQAAAATQERVNAAQFANAAQGHANTAQVQAAAAQNAAGAAAASAGNAAADADDAYDHMIAASGSATNAAASAAEAQQSFTLADAARQAAQAAAQDAQDVLDSIPEDYSTLSNNYTNKTEPTIINSPYQVRKIFVASGVYHQRGIPIDQIFVNQREGESTRIIIRSKTNARSYRYEQFYSDGTYTWSTWTRANTNVVVTPAGKTLTKISLEVPNADGDEDFTLIVIQDPFLTDVYNKLPV